MISRSPRPAGPADAAPGDTVHVWLIPSDLPPAVLAGLDRLLDADERRRVEALAFRDHRRHFAAAHGGVRSILARHLGVAADQIRWSRGPHGKPELAGAFAPARCGPQVSISHSDGVTMLAVSATRRVGVDIQHLPRRFDAAGMATRYFPREEARYVADAGDPAAQTRRFITLWARKEACVKVVGGRLMQGMALAVRAGDQSGRAGIVIHQPAGPIPGPYLLHELPVAPGFRAAVAAEGVQEYQLARHHWRPLLTPP